MNNYAQLSVSPLESPQAMSDNGVCVYASDQTRPNPRLDQPKPLLTQHKPATRQLCASTWHLEKRYYFGDFEPGRSTPEGVRAAALTCAMIQKKIKNGVMTTMGSGVVGKIPGGDFGGLLQVVVGGKLTSEEAEFEREYPEHEWGTDCQCPMCKTATWDEAY